MKFTPIQLCIVLGILFAAIIAAHIFAPAAVVTVTAMATTLFAALFVQKKDEASKDGEE